ncbi:hypothetical protein CMK12_08395 [Candidatus Poribacteria bacterium]|jgi:hypothetical protein|nr:hypothetical protein [Candidatus Poribacteria bacterium]MDP6595943.1 hypothetical protein [Candidatus Poribacteria bacterium]MDP6746371.1 hypothetical protein [Candidatus Poribacteria bacterium]MDP6995366.1 hypothetical protein [Candidatus Poribacteria bacterium]
MKNSDPLRQQVEAAVRQALAKMAETDANSAKSVLVILDAGAVSLDVCLAQLAECRQNGHSLTALISSLASQVYNLDIVRSAIPDLMVETTDLPLGKLVSDFSLLVIPVLTINIMAKLSLGVSDTPTSYLLVQALQQGKTIIAIDQQHSTETTGYADHLRQQVLQYQQRLQSFGLRFVPVNRLAESIVKSSKQIHFCPATDQRSKLLGRDWIDQLPLSIEEIICPASTVITPLAFEEAKKRGVMISLMEAKP